MRLPLFIACRYLFAKKSHNVINVISAISAVGMAVGTAALVVIQSVYNGFDDLVRTSVSRIEPDILIVPDTGKVFLPAGPVFERIAAEPAVVSVSGILQENVYVSYDGRNGIARAKGVDRAYEEAGPLEAAMIDGSFELHHGTIPETVAGAGLA